MNNTTLRHDQAKALLPWYANGTLDEDERHGVHVHLKECSACRADYELLCEIDSAVNETVSTPMVPRPDVARLFAAIDADKPPVRRAEFSSRHTVIAATLAATLVIAVFFGRGLFSTAGPTQFETATSSVNALNIDYVMRIRFEPDTSELERNATFAALAGRNVTAEAESGAYRLIVSVPGTSLEEVEAYTDPVKSRAEVASIEIIAVQLPMSNE